MESCIHVSVWTLYQKAVLSWAKNLPGMSERRVLSSSKMASTIADIIVLTVNKK